MQDKEDAETAAMELDSDIDNTLSPLKSAIVQRDLDDFQRYTDDVEQLAEEILEIKISNYARCLPEPGFRARFQEGGLYSRVISI